MENKDIDRLFQEKFKDMEVTPNPKVWEAIEKKLQKKKRRILPFWWLSGAGAVASILIVFFLFNTKTENKSNLPVITNKSDALPEPINFKINTKNEVLITNTKEENISIENKKDLPREKNNSITKVGEKTILINNNSSKNQKNSNEYQYITHKKDNSDNNDSIKSYQKANHGLNSNSLLTDNSSEKENNVNKSINNSTDNTEVNQSLSLSNNYTENNKDNITSILNNDDIDIKEKNTTENDTIKKKDFIAEMNKKDNDILEESNDTKNWKVNPVLGILNSNSFTDDSPIDNSLTFSGDNSFAYGVNVEYALNKKWTLKSGIQLQKSSFSSEQINNISNLNVLRSFANIDVDVVRSISSDQIIEEESEVIELENFSDDQSVDPEILTPNDNSSDKEESLKQLYSYIEIPIETKYTFYNKPKTQMSLVSGFSTLVLSENKILTVVDGTEETVGELTNLNTLNFSGNLGIDIEFLILDKINFNINPMFKSQLNTFTTNSTNFHPYIIGVYSGLKYQF